MDLGRDPDLLDPGWASISPTRPTEETAAQIGRIPPHLLYAETSTEAAVDFLISYLDTSCPSATPDHPRPRLIRLHFLARVCSNPGISTTERRLRLARVCPRPNLAAPRTPASSRPRPGSGDFLRWTDMGIRLLVKVISLFKSGTALHSSLQDHTSFGD